MKKNNLTNNEEIKKLEQEILKHKKLYYAGNREIEDEEFDQLEARLKKIDPTNPVFDMVGSSFFSSEPIKHNKEMLSLDKSYEQQDIIDFLKHGLLLATFKVDGSSCSLVYNKSLQIAKTRGDGHYGENISVSASFINNIPKQIKFNKEIEIRGEIFCTVENFAKLSLEMVKRNLEKPKSLRNITAGLLGRKENQDLCQFLTFYAYDVVSDDFKTESEKINYLQELGFETPEFSLIKNETDIENFIEFTGNFMNEGDYQIDGAVFSVNEISVQKSLGETKHHPRYKIAFKFEGEIKETVINAIEWQISRFGIYTPVAILNPVEIKGAIINKVTLHNKQLVETYQIKIGDRIKLIRSGEVIPKFIGVVQSSNNRLEIPKKCYHCDSKLEHDEVRLMCTNKKCAGRALEDIIQFAKKINIEDLSEKRIEQMIKAKLVSSVSDLFKLNQSSLLKLEGFKDTLTNKILINIEKSKELSIINFFDALGFTGGAKHKVELILQNKKINNVKDFFKLSEEDLVEIKGFGEKGIHAFLSSLKDKKNIINELIDECGIKVTIPKLVESDLLNNLTFCITGETSIPRKDLEKIIKSNGGKSTSSVSKNLNYLICNEDSSSSKNKKAKDLNIEIINEDNFKKKFKINY